LRAAAIGVGEALGTVAKKVCVVAGQREQALFRRRMRFDRAVGADVAKRQSAFGQRATDQQAAMAVERLALRTQQTDAMARDLIHYTLETDHEFRPRSHRLVVGDAVAIKLWIARAAAERVTQRKISDALARKPLRQRENGTERTSATAVTPALVSRAMKRSAGRLEWPMVRRS
jgi:hypothetical protein